MEKMFKDLGNIIEVGDKYLSKFIRVAGVKVRLFK